VPTCSANRSPQTGMTFEKVCEDTNIGVKDKIDRVGLKSNNIATPDVSMNICEEGLKYRIFYIKQP